MPPPFDHSFAGDLPAPYDRVYSEAATFVPASRLITDPLRLLTWGTDASFYRLVPKIIVVIESEDELQRLLSLRLPQGQDQSAQRCHAAAFG